MTSEHRVKRLKKFLNDNKRQNQREVAISAGINPSFLSQLVGGHSSFGEKAARNLEGKLGLPPFYFDGDFDVKELVESDEACNATKQLNKFRALSLGESCKLNPTTTATRVVGGWIYTLECTKLVDGAEVVTTSSCFAPFTTQYELDGMVDELIADINILSV